LAVGVGTKAERHKWSEVSSKKPGRREDLDEKNADRPRDFLAWMMESNSWISRSLDCLVSRSWINSLNATTWLVLSSRWFEEKLTLCLLQHLCVLLLIMWQTFQETIHIETVDLSA
jgi:hypothetical protein